MKQRKDGRWPKTIVINGEPVHFYSRAKTEKAAERDIARQMIEYREKLERGELFRTVADNWEREHWPSLQNNTLKQYRPAKAQVVKTFGDMHIKEIETADISAFLKALKKQGYAKKTIQSRKLVCSLILDYAMEHRLLKSNPCKDAKLPKDLPQKKREPPKDIDVEKIKTKKDTDAAVLALFYLYSGCRKGEALALEPADFDKKNKSVHISKTVEWIGQVPQIKYSPKTEAGIREIPLPDFIFDLLKPRMRSKYIFANQYGELYRDSQFTRMWDKYKAELGIEATPHQLRHAYATMLYDAGVDVKTAQKWLGHADIETTLEIYTHLSELRQGNSKEKWLNFIDSNEISA